MGDVMTKKGPPSLQDWRAVYWGSYVPMIDSGLPSS